jgi:hypothetical protein
MSSIPAVRIVSLENFFVMAMILLYQTGCTERGAGKRSWLLKKLDSFEPLQKCSTNLVGATAKTG